MQIPRTSADLRILQNLRFFALNNKTQTNRQRRQACFCSLWNDKADEDKTKVKIIFLLTLAHEQ